MEITVFARLNRYVGHGILVQMEHKQGIVLTDVKIQIKKCDCVKRQIIHAFQIGSVVLGVVAGFPKFWMKGCAAMDAGP